jgi:quinol monooxygenase YgiN
MIVITAKFRVKPEFVETWPEIASAFTTATRAEAGCLWFDWSRSLDQADEYVLIEAFRDDDAGAAHVQSDHFNAAMQDLPPYLASTPLIINTKAAGEGWSELGELAVRE